eukprot:1296338-Alexandrium_andersonii.AAC.1
MSASLVGSEMCIRDSPRSHGQLRCASATSSWGMHGAGALLRSRVGRGTSCLLYTSDAADDM